MLEWSINVVSEGMWKEAVVACFKLFSHNLSDETEKDRECDTKRQRSVTIFFDNLKA
jgi:hypothetical protein